MWFDHMYKLYNNKQILKLALYGQQGISVLEFWTILIFRHIQCHFTALSDDRTRIMKIPEIFFFFFCSTILQLIDYIYTVEGLFTILFKFCLPVSVIKRPRQDSMIFKSLNCFLNIILSYQLPRFFYATQNNIDIWVKLSTFCE